MFLKSRREEIELFMRNPAEVQDAQLEALLLSGAETVYGRERGMGSITSYEEFAARVPIVDYVEFHDYFLRSKSGENGVVWPSRIQWFARSSGTTDDISKYIPVTDEGLKGTHMQGPTDVMVLYLRNFSDSNVLLGKMLTLGGSKKIEKEGTNIFSGDLSAILIENTPWWAKTRRSPSPSIALIPDFEKKIEAIYESCKGENITSFAGVPSWNLVMMQYILERSGKENLHELWPDMELFVHGGINFEPYRNEYRRLFPDDRMRYVDTYNASEGFFAIEDEPNGGDMLLMLDYGQFYEFLPVDSLADRSKAVPLAGVREGVNYAMIITSQNGLWRYMIGDTVMFTSTSPYRIRITGRTKHYINAFGEEVMVENVETAVAAACEATGAQVSNYTVAPLYMESGSKGAHQWVVEFAGEPDGRDRFMDVVDTKIQELNSDYKAKRFKNTTLAPPVLTVVPEGTFMSWLASKGRIGGQHKVPRLSNDRNLAENILSNIQ